MEPFWVPFIQLIMAYAAHQCCRCCCTSTSAPWPFPHIVPECFPHSGCSWGWPSSPATLESPSSTVWPHWADRSKHGQWWRYWTVRENKWITMMHNKVKTNSLCCFFLSLEPCTIFLQEIIFSQHIIWNQTKEFYLHIFSSNQFPLMIFVTYWSGLAALMPSGCMTMTRHSGSPWSLSPSE